MPSSLWRDIAIFSVIALIWLSWGADSIANEQSQSQSGRTLCNEDEDIYFSCQLNNGKTASICANRNTTPNRGYVKYKYGIEGNAFVFPRNNIPPRNIFKLSDVSEGSIRGLHLKFSSGPYVYVISSVWPGGVYVSKHGSVVLSQKCQASKYKNFSNKVFEGITPAIPSSVDIN
jgi:hypothetical protein